MMENFSLECRERFDFFLKSELRSGSVVDLRVVDMLVVDVRFDMEEMTTTGLSEIVTLAGSSYPTRSWS